jgi:hypothetical protein
MLKEGIENAKKRYYKLLILAGPSGAGKTEMLLKLSNSAGYPYLNLNQELSHRMLELPSKDRALEVQRLIEDILNEIPDDVVLLDNIEILFSRNLEAHPIRLLQNLSRRKTIVATWNGDYDGEKLTYAEPWHPEYQMHMRADIDAIIYPITNEEGAINEI